MCVCVGGCILQPLRAAGGWGVPACPPSPGSRAGPVGCQAPAPSQPKSPAPGDRGGRCGGRCGAPSCWCGQRDPGSAVRGASSAAAPGERGESHVHPLPRSPPLPPAWAAPRRSGCAYPGHRPDETLLLLRLPLAGRASPQSPTGHPSPPPGAGDRLGFGPREVAAFRLSEPPALRLPLRPGRAAACGHLVGDPAVLTLEREGFPESGCLLPLPPGHPPANGPQASGELTFPSLRACLMPLRCIWVISLDSTTGSCCRARLPDVERAALEGGVCCGPVVG